VVFTELGRNLRQEAIDMIVEKGLVDRVQQQGAATSVGYRMLCRLSCLSFSDGSVLI